MTECFILNIGSYLEHGYLEQQIGKCKIVHRSDVGNQILTLSFLCFFFFWVYASNATGTILFFFHALGHQKGKPFFYNYIAYWMKKKKKKAYKINNSQTLQKTTDVVEMMILESSSHVLFSWPLWRSFVGVGSPAECQLPWGAVWLALSMQHLNKIYCDHSCKCKQKQLCVVTVF